MKMSKVMSLVLAATVALSLNNSAFAATMSDAYKHYHPSVTQERYDYAQTLFEQAKPNMEKFRNGVFESSLPRISNEYAWSVSIGYDDVYVGTGGTTAKKSFDVSKEVVFTLGIMDGQGDLASAVYTWHPDTKTISTYTLDQYLTDALKSETDPQPIPSKPTLTDISNHWAKDYIAKAVERGYVAGYEDQTFRPDNNISRSEFVAMLVKALKLDAGNKPATVFTDDSGWAEGYIQAAIEKGIIKVDEYTNSEFQPEKNITRQEIAVMTVRAANLEGRATTKTLWELIISKLSDLPQIPEQWRGFVKVANDVGILTGYEDGTFRANNSASRSEAVVMVERTLSKLGQ